MVVDKNEQDLLLINKALAGDKHVYRTLVDKHKKYVYTIVFRILGTKQDSEEVAQDVFIKAFSSLGSFNREAKFTTWLYRIAYNQSISYLRKRKGNYLAIDQMDESQYMQDSEFQDLVSKQQKELIDIALVRLQPDDVSVLTLFYLRERSLEEVADSMGISANSVKVKLFRARQRMGRQMHEMLNKEVNSLL